MMLQYNLSDFQDVNEFLSKLALKMGSLKKGGIPDIHKSAQRVLSDWTNGKLTYFTEPPERPTEILSTELVTQMKKASDINSLLNNEDTETSLSSSTPIEVDLEMDEDHQNSSEVFK